MHEAERKNDDCPPDAERLRQLRLLNERSQEECGAALGIGQSSYARMETGQTQLRRRDRVTLAVFYGMKVEDAFPDEPAALAGVG